MTLRRTGDVLCSARTSPQAAPRLRTSEAGPGPRDTEDQCPDGSSLALWSPDRRKP